MKGEIEMKTMKILNAVLIIMLIASLSYAQRNEGKGERWDVDNVVTVNGTITNNSRPYAILRGDDNQEYEVHLGPIWYWEQNNYSLDLSNVTIKGELKNYKGKNELYPFEIIQSGRTMKFADDNGVPYWSGGKGKKGKGWRRGYNNSNWDDDVRGPGWRQGKQNCWRWQNN
ncbi:MAG: hypothetical protein FJ216_02240 [Ignavibacteria bacterium]|nr:hypothetical protein [Ignavibacteria bacterium]